VFYRAASNLKAVKTIFYKEKQHHKIPKSCKNGNSPEFKNVLQRATTS
jgi:hypothetical protein